MFFNKKIKRMEEKIKELENNCRISYKDPNAFWGHNVIGVSDILEDLIGKMGYKIIPSTIKKVELKKVKILIKEEK